MELIIRLSALAVLAALLALLLKGRQGELGLLVALAGLGALLFSLGEPLGDLITFLRTLSEGTGLDAAVFAPLYKILGIALVVQLGGDLCRDAGESALAAGLETAGSVCAMLAALPLLERTLTLLGELMGA